MQHLITAYDEADFSSIPDNLSGTNCVRQNSRAKNLHGFPIESSVATLFPSLFIDRWERKESIS